MLEAEEVLGTTLPTKDGAHGQNAGRSRPRLWLGRSDGRFHRDGDVRGGGRQVEGMVGFRSRA
jgi:hypothetical protein